MAFGVKRFGEPISRVALRKTIDTGITFDQLPGCIPIYYEMEACREANYRYFGDWQDLTPAQQSKIVAHYLLRLMVAQHQHDAENAYQERQQRRAKRN